MLENNCRTSVHEMEEKGSDFTVLLLIRITSSKKDSADKTDHVQLVDT